MFSLLIMRDIYKRENLKVYSPGVVFLERIENGFGTKFKCSIVIVSVRRSKIYSCCSNFKQFA